MPEFRYSYLLINKVIHFIFAQSGSQVTSDIPCQTGVENLWNASRLNSVPLSAVVAGQKKPYRRPPCWQVVAALYAWFPPFPPYQHSYSCSPFLGPTQRSGKLTTSWHPSRCSNPICARFSDVVALRRTGFWQPPSWSVSDTGFESTMQEGESTEKKLKSILFLFVTVDLMQWKFCMIGGFEVKYVRKFDVSLLIYEANTVHSSDSA